MMIIRRILLFLLALGVLLAVYGFLAAAGHLGKHQNPGSISQQAIPATIVKQRLQERATAAKALDVESQKQILFGDLHVHTTFSNDAYTGSLPMMNGEGSHPPADACDYARYCSALDFWSINDHAVSLSTQRWEETKDSIRQCNAVTDPQNPDVVAFLGYEWTQADPADADKHYGHKNVVFRHIEEDKVAARPIFAETETGPAAFNPPLFDRAVLALTNLPANRPYLDYNRYMREMEADPECPKGVAPRDLPADCKEGAATPVELFQKLDASGYDSIVIPHGNTWGLYTPPATTWDKQLAGAMQDAKRQFMVEVFSGHGNSEEYRDWRSFSKDANGKLSCPDARPDFLPLCVQAGRIIQQRCLAEGESEEECENRAAEARQYAVESAFPMPTVPGAQTNDWLDSDQCKDCFLPAYNYRPGGASQYALAIGNFDDPEKIRRFRFGFMASSDNHTARPGTGFKELDRRENVEGFVVRDQTVRNFLLRNQPGPQARAIPMAATSLADQATGVPRLERGSAFFLTGGLIAVHAEHRDRDGIWDAMQRKEIYGTSGDRIFLWFDMLNPEAQDSNGAAPMGSELAIGHTPKFRVRAVGAFKQKPGCPEYSVAAVGEQRLQRLCRNECYNPAQERKLITRIEVIRIRPQLRPDENVNELIEDSWLVHNCKADTSGCSFEFEDPDFIKDGRETVYYARAIEEPSLAVNAANMRCEYDAQGQCIKANACSDADLSIDAEDDCLAENEERAWSSPIFIDYEQGSL